MIPPGAIYIRAEGQLEMRGNEMARPTTEKQRRKLTHLVLFPCPLQGHITPMLQLASVLHSRGLFSITIMHTQFNSPNPANHPNFKFQPISDGLSADEAMSDDVMGLLALLNVKCHRPFHDLLARMLADEDDPSGPIACIVSDAVMHFAQSVADHLKIPRIILRTSSAASFVTCTAFPLLREKGYLPVQGVYVCVSLYIYDEPIRWTHPTAETLPRPLLDPSPPPYAHA
ncbi:hypothetical protein ACLOJK_012553 [Asimina triloba]